jgi:ubiquinone/menaquinone biosynthesis C-methylase UbiE
MKNKVRKVDLNFTVRSFNARAAVEKYSAAVDSVRLWESEKIFFSTHFKRSDRLLDLGCGAGRTTFWLWRGGYKHITGADITPGMIRSARRFAKERGIPIDFVLADGRDLPFADAEFDGCLFSFNGLMQIPGRRNRIAVMKEVRRILKIKGTFVFVTHDRETARENTDFWKGEKKRWRTGRHDPRLLEYGDMIIHADGRKGKESFIHIPDRKEILDCLKTAGLKHVEDRLLPEISEEPPRIRKLAYNCRFWAVKKR